MKQKDKANVFDMCYENYVGYLKESEDDTIDKTPLTEEEFGNMLGEIIMDYNTYFFKLKKEGENE